MKCEKLICTVLFCFTFLMVSLKTNGQEKQKANKVIVIDAGHGGTDFGAIGMNGIEEKTIVLNIAKNIVDINNNVMSSKLAIYLTRYSDTLIALSDRTRLAKSLKADLFISLHCNQSENPNSKGVEVFAPKQKGKFSSHSIFMGYIIEKTLTTIIGIKSRGVKFENFQVLRETIYYCPALLVEFGFLSNWDENKYFANKRNSELLAMVILESILKYFGL